MFYLYAYTARTEPGVLVNDLSTDFGISSSFIGFVISIAYLPYLIMQIPYGIIVDKLGPRIVASSCCLACAIGVLIFGMATSVFHLELGRFLIGLFSSSAYVCCGKVARDCFDKKKYALLMGAASVAGCLGGVFGSAPIVFLSTHIGWRKATFVIAAIGVAISILTLFVVPGRNDQLKISGGGDDIWSGIKAITKNPKIWLLGFCCAVLYLPVCALAELWIIPFLEIRFGISTKMASIGAITIFIGISAGSLLSAWIAEKINSYKKVIITCSVLFIWPLWMALYSDSISYSWCIFFLMVSSLLSASNILAYEIACSMVPDKYSGTATGFMNAIIVSSGVIFQPLLGRLLDFFRNGLVNDMGRPIYTIVIYRSAFLFIIFGAV
ncbi:MAG: MFS transporter, partial [Holosporales bacterium]|nr:MFS transporter [Holosporales bacterium]